MGDLGDEGRARRQLARDEIAKLHEERTDQKVGYRNVESILDELEEINRKFDEIGTQRNNLIESYNVLQERNQSRYKELTCFPEEPRY